MNQPINVLIIEDNPMSLKLASDAITGPLMRTEGAASLKEGLARLRRDGIDVVLLDLFLPDAHGVKAVQKLQEQAPKVPFVVLTAEANQQTACILAGAQEFLTKPAPPDLIIERLRTAVIRHMVRGDLAPLKDAIESAKEAAGELKKEIREAKDEVME